MASRPYLNYSGKQLKVLFETIKADEPGLRVLRTELVYRNTPTMRDLLLKVDRALSSESSATVNDDAVMTYSAGLNETQIPLDFPIMSEDSDTLGAAKFVAEPAETNQAFPTENADAEMDQTIPISGTTGSIRPCDVLLGVPKPFTFPEKRDFEIEVGKNAPRAERFVAALRALIKDMRKLGAGMRSVNLENGVAVELDGRERGYSFPYDGDAELFEGAKVTITSLGRTCNGKIISVTGQSLILAFDEDFGPRIGNCILRIDNTAMLEALADVLDKVRTGEYKLNTVLADDVLGNRENQVPDAAIDALFAADSSLNSEQKRFVAHALANKVTYLWGPPGTGKTLSLGSLNEAMFAAGKRILICSNTNQAVDQVLLKLCETLKVGHPALEDGRVLRIGKTDGITKEWEEYVTLAGIVRRKSVDLQVRKRQLENEIERIKVASEGARRILGIYRDFDNSIAEQEELSQRISELERDHSDVQAQFRSCIELIARLDKELIERDGAGALRRLFKRPAERIRADLAKAQEDRSVLAEKLPIARHARNNPELQVRQRDLAARAELLRPLIANENRAASERVLQAAESEVATYNNELAEISQKLGDMEKSIVTDARIVGATVTKTYLAPQLFENFDTVIIDEASMVMLPAVYFVSGLAKEKVIVSGDFRQLSPIVPTEQQAILDVIGRDVFEAAGIKKAVKTGKLKRTVMLTQQYRMTEGICELISQKMYEGRLRTASSRQQRNRRLPAPFDGELTVIDTSKIQPFVNKHGSSRYNLMNALAVRNLLRHFRKNGFLVNGKEIGVCTPFSAQKDILKRLLANEGVDVGTVHRYQGNEKPAMVIDIPDSVGEHYVSLFAQGESPDSDGAKLFNVAVSRAEEHVIFIANLNYLDAKLPAEAFLRHLLHAASTEGNVIDAEKVLGLWPISADLNRIGRLFTLNPETLRSGLFKQEDFSDVFGADIERAEKSIVIYSGFVTLKRIAVDYDSLFRRKIAQGIKIRCVTRPPKRNGSIPEAEGRQALDALEAIGCVVDTRWEIHEKVAIIDDETVWFGSLNPLSFTTRTDEAMFRFVDKSAALQLSVFMSKAGGVSADKAEGLSVLGENPRCPDCGMRSTYRTGSYGPFWQCENECGWKQSVGKSSSAKASPAKPASKASSPCPICGSATTLRSGRYGPFYGCSKYPTCKGTVK